MSRRRYRYSSANASLNVPEGFTIPFTDYDVWLAKHKKRPLATKVLGLMCQGKLHKIKFEFPGSVTMLHHKSIKDEELMAKLGGEIPECVTFMKQWKDKPRDVAVTRPIVRGMLEARNRWSSARITTREAYTDRLALNPETKIPIIPLGNRLTQRLEYLIDRLKVKISKKLKHDPYLGWRTYNPRHEDQESWNIRAKIRLNFFDQKNHQGVRIATPNEKEENQ